MYNPEQIAETIRRLCKEKNISQSTLLEQAEVNRNFFYDCKRSFPKVDTIARIADILQVSIDTLIGREI